MPVVDPMVATVGLLLLHVPPVPSVYVGLLPRHTADGPEIGTGIGSTVTICVAEPQLFV